jgi:Polyketide cyclase / dehydrase and lipid transport
MADTEERTSITDALPTDALKDAGQRLLGLLVQNAAESATARINGLSDRLNSVAEDPGQGLGTVFGRSRDQSEDTDDDGDGDGKSGGLLSRGFSALKEKIGKVFGGGGGGGQGKKLKVTVISEDQDIGLPLRTTYNLWTQFADFPSFMKKVESVEQASDEKTNWKAQVFLSHRTWEATVVEQVPDSHIVWRSKGQKGHVDGAVTFTELGPNLTRVMLVLEYHPQGLFERTGNLWRAQGRRARLEFQHFRRHAMSNVLLHQDEVEGWRGEIHDSEVVKTHEEALEEEQRAEEQPEESGEEESAQDTGEAAEEEPYEESAEDESGEEESGEAEQPYDEEDEYADEDEPSDEEYLEDDGEYEADVDEEPADDADADTEADEAREPVAASRSRRER